MKICCVADLHCYLPEIPDCDLLLIAGDVTHHNRKPQLPSDIARLYAWAECKFAPWLDDLRKRDIQVIGVAGNHDFIFYDDRQFGKSLPWIYLEDSGYNYQGINIWGSPWQPQFGDWAFNAKESRLAEYWKISTYYCCMDRLSHISITAYLEMNIPAPSLSGIVSRSSNHGT